MKTQTIYNIIEAIFSDLVLLEPCTNAQLEHVNIHIEIECFGLRIFLRTVIRYMKALIKKSPFRSQNDESVSNYMFGTTVNARNHVVRLF